MEILREFWINVENNLHQILIWVFNMIHTTIDCFSAIIEQWLLIEEDIKQEQDNNNRKNKIGF